MFQGYCNNETATAEMFDDGGWLLTGDIGTLDVDGFLRITGRKKELIITAAGKNVAPAPLEDRLSAHPLISQAVVVGDARPFIAALITLDPAAMSPWATEHGLGDVRTCKNWLEGNLLFPAVTEFFELRKVCPEIPRAAI